MAKLVYVLNGPNLNLLGERQPEIYGYETLADIEAMCRQVADEFGFDVDFRQSNAEHEIVDSIQEARTRGSAIVINAAAFTHTSVAILDALKTCDFPIFEVHISNVFRREDFRHHSYVSLAATGMIAGFGPQGYVLALRRVGSILASESG